MATDEKVKTGFDLLMWRKPGFGVHMDRLIRDD